LVSRMMNRSRSESSQIDVPVKTHDDRKHAPPFLCRRSSSRRAIPAKGTEEPGGRSWRVVNFLTKDGAGRRKTEEGDGEP